MRPDGAASPARGRSPFSDTVPAILFALVFATAALTWVAFADSLPGDRWLAVHLFTLGVLTNLVLAFTHHFATTLTRQPSRSIALQTATVNVGISGVIIGLPTDSRWLVAAGATTVTAVAIWSYVRIRRMRTAAVGVRFAWIVRAYEHAHGAFVLGAVLGALMGTGLLRGEWYLAARTAHLHAMVLGWGGVTLLATLVFFGPTMARTRIVEGADAHAARALRIGVLGLLAGVLLLLSTGAGGTAGSAVRVAAAASLAVFAWATTVVALAVGRAALAAKPSAARWPLLAVSAWCPVVVWADVVIVGAGWWQLLDAAGLAVLLGVLAQSITTVLGYLAPMLRGHSRDARSRVLARVGRFADARAAIYNLGVAAVVSAAVARGPLGAQAAAVGWGMLATALLVLGAASMWPLGQHDTKVPPTSGGRGG